MRRFATLFVVVSIGLSLSGEAIAQQKPVPSRAFLLSFAVPGLGQYYAGAPNAAKRFLMTELVILAGYRYSTSLRDASAKDYLTYVTRHAGVNPAGYGSRYLAALGGYDSSFDYNGAQLTEAQPLLYTGNQTWQWDSPSSRQRYHQLRERELDYDNYVTYCVAGIILNHFLSGLNAARLARQTYSGSAEMMVAPLPDGMYASLSWRCR